MTSRRRYRVRAVNGTLGKATSPQPVTEKLYLTDEDDRVRGMGPGYRHDQGG